MAWEHQPTNGIASTTNTYDLTNPIAGETNSTYTPPTNTVGEVFYFWSSRLMEDVVIYNPLLLW